MWAVSPNNPQLTWLVMGSAVPWGVFWLARGERDYCWVAMPILLVGYWMDGAAGVSLAVHKY